MLQYLLMDLFHREDAHADRPEWRPQVYASTPLAIACMPLPALQNPHTLR